jgi:signal transduction histidine kinase/CheY-like chemotaxis protein
MNSSDDPQDDLAAILKDATRLAALARTGLLDSPAEPSFDRLARLAANFLGSPVALVSLVDAERQFFKSCIGLPEPWASRREAPLSHSFCKHVLATREPLVINDARLHPLVKDNPAIADLSVIAYLGIPLAVDDQVIGSFCVIDGNPRSWTDDEIALLRDLAESVITEIRLRSERDQLVRQGEELRETRSRLQFALKSARMGTWDWDLVTHVLAASDTCKSNHGLTSDEPFTYDGWAAAVLDIDRPAWRLAVAEAAAGNSDLNIEYRTRWPDGSVHWVCVQGSCLRDTTGRTVSMSGVSFNVDDRKQAEHDLQMLVEQLQEHDQQKNDFLATLAHELRNPLAAISNAVMLMSMSEAKEHRDYSTETIKRQSNHLSRLIDDLLDISRINLGKIELRREIIDATTILDSAAQTVGTLVEGRKHTLDVAIDRGNLWVDADPTRLEQVVVNLLTNAAKYSENGGRIQLSANREDDMIVIRVKDAGIGIAPEKLPEMFRLFNQIDHSSTRSEGGLGIGLAIVKQLVELHEGTITATSEGLGKGSEFTIRLPAATRPASTIPVPTKAIDVKEKTQVLVVDDNVDTVQGMAILLNLAGHEVLTAHDGPTAIAVARSCRPQVILLDLGLPGMSGYDVARHLREEQACKDALIVAVSGYGQEEDRHRTEAAGFDHHLVKPVSYDELFTLLSPTRPRY